MAVRSAYIFPFAFEVLLYTARCYFSVSASKLFASLTFFFVFSVLIGHGLVDFAYSVDANHGE
jgi:hypothetical protein